MVNPKKQTAQRPMKAVLPPYFLSYSTGETHISLFTECLDIVFRSYFTRQATPEVLQTDKSQHDLIVELIQGCAFGVVCLDGLRPNVIFEYGAMRGANIPVLLFKEENAKVDIAHFFGSAGLMLPDNPPIAVDRHFSDTKDRYYIPWSRFKIQETVDAIWDNYSKKRNDIPQYREIPKPKL
jgi:hypothetical protein